MDRNTYSPGKQWEMVSSGTDDQTSSITCNSIAVITTRIDSSWHLCVCCCICRTVKPILGNDGKRQFHVSCNWCPLGWDLQSSPMRPETTAYVQYLLFTAYVYCDALIHWVTSSTASSCFVVWCYKFTATAGIIGCIDMSGKWVRHWLILFIFIHI